MAVLSGVMAVVALQLTAAYVSAQPHALGPTADGQQLPPPRVAAPDPGETTLVSCNSTKGPFHVAVHRNWAPLGSARFLEMVGSGLHVLHVHVRAHVHNAVPPRFHTQSTRCVPNTAVVGAPWPPQWHCGYTLVVGHTRRVATQEAQACQPALRFHTNMRLEGATCLGPPSPGQLRRPDQQSTTTGLGFLGMTSTGVVRLRLASSAPPHTRACSGPVPAATGVGAT